MLTLGIAALGLALAGILVSPLFLVELTDHATALLLAGGLFTIALAAVVGE